MNNPKIKDDKEDKDDKDKRSIDVASVIFCDYNNLGMGKSTKISVARHQRKVDRFDILETFSQT
jgi:hypothetical protein